MQKLLYTLTLARYQNNTQIYQTTLGLMTWKIPFLNHYPVIILLVQFSSFTSHF